MSKLSRVLGRLAGEVARRQGSRAARQAWHTGLGEEARFWQAWVASRGLDWPQEFERRLAGDVPVTDTLLLEAISRTEGHPVRILDVGAGPVSLVGTVCEGRRVELTPIDPLADRYREMLRAAGITPPVETLPGEGERLLELFGEERFDIACAFNALDHAYDPVAIIVNMVAVVRKGGFVVLVHGRNEGEERGYRGLHQWNFDLRSGRFVVWRPGAPARDVERVLGRPVRATYTVRDWGESDGIACLLERLPGYGSEPS